MEAAIVAALVSALVTLVGYLITIQKSRRMIELEREKIDVSLKELAMKERDFELRAQAVDADISVSRSELKIKQEELRTLQSQVENFLSEIEQGQHTEVLRKRLDAYPEVYALLQKYNRIWRSSNKKLDHDWSGQFLEAILDVNAKYGVLFSQEVYSAFYNLREILYDLEERLRNGGLATEEDLELIDGVISGPLRNNGDSRGAGLGSFLKDDLGSYRKPFLSARRIAQT